MKLNQFVCCSLVGWRRHRPSSPAECTIECVFRVFSECARIHSFCQSLRTGKANDGRETRSPKKLRLLLFLFGSYLFARASDLTISHSKFYLYLSHFNCSEWSVFDLLKTGAHNKQLISTGNVCGSREFHLLSIFRPILSKIYIRLSILISISNISGGADAECTIAIAIVGISFHL